METLADRIARDGPVKELDAVGWAIRLAKRLEALHALGVAHGSVSPACILAASGERTAKGYLADVQLTTSKPAFQSPERIVGGDISPADDTWAVAATLYAILTGEAPFAATNEAETRQKILVAQPPPLAVYDVGDDDLQHILDQAFARELSARTTTVMALRSALEEWHPDPSVGALLPLDDEDSLDDSDDLDDAQTVMLVNAVYVPKVKADADDERLVTQKPSPPVEPLPASASPRLSPLAAPASPALSPLAAPASPPMASPMPCAVAPPEPPDNDDDDDNIRTVMRDPLMPPSTGTEAMGDKTLEIVAAPVKPRIAAFAGDAALDAPGNDGGSGPGLLAHPPAMSPWGVNRLPGPILAPAPRKFQLGMVIATLLAIIVAAALTFAFMRYHMGG